MTKQFDVYAIGNGIMDLQLHVSNQVFDGLGLERGTMNLVDTEAQSELLRSFQGENIHRASGGSAANTVIAVTQLGGKCAYGCLLGDDEFGQFYGQEMSELGVELYTTPVEGGVTGSSVILITEDAERTMNTHLGVSAEFGPDQVSSRLIAASSWLYIEGYLFSTDGGRQAVKQALTYALKSNTKVALTFSDVFIVEAFRDEVKKTLKYCDLVFANLKEAGTYVGKDSEEEIFEEMKRLCPSVAMTMSERGAKISIDGEDMDLEPYPVTAVDDTGAGDMFAGGLLYGLTHGLQPKFAGHLACFLASRVVAQLGPRLAEDPKGFEEVQGFLEVE